MTIAELLVIHTPLSEVAAKAAVLKEKEITINGKSHNLDLSGIKISFNNVISVLNPFDISILEGRQND